MIPELRLSGHWTPPAVRSFTPIVGCSCFAPFGLPCPAHRPKPKPQPYTRILVPFGGGDGPTMPLADRDTVKLALFGPRLLYTVHDEPNR
jgi:hypothetical protein